MSSHPSSLRNFLGYSLLTMTAIGCGPQHVDLTVANASTTTQSAPLLISVVSDMDANPQAVDMAMKLAGFALDEGRQVFVFFNVKGVRVPLKALPADAAFGSGPPVREQLIRLMERGALIHACPVCMKGLGVVAQDLLDGIVVTDRATLFAHITPHTCVFTY